MFSLLLAIVFFGNYVASVPIDPSHSESSPPSPIDATVLPTRRSTFDIIWSCLLTLFLCTWTTMHPNIPPPNESVLHMVLKRIKLMLWTLFVPELILIWAVKQWLAAGYIAGMFKDHKWTRVHGHFLGMGGFTLVNDPKRAAASQRPEMPELPEALKKAVGQGIELRELRELREEKEEEEEVEEELPLNEEPWIRDEEQRFLEVLRRFEQEQKRYKDLQQWDEELQREERLRWEVGQRLRREALPLSSGRHKGESLQPLGVDVLLRDRKMGLEHWEGDVRRREEELQRLETLVRRRDEEPSPLDSELQPLKGLLQRRTEELRSLKLKVQRRKEEVSRMEGLLQRKDEREKVRRNSVGLKRAEGLVRHLEEKRLSSMEERNLEVLREYEELQRWARGEDLVEKDQRQPQSWEGPQQQPGREELQLRWNELLRNWEELLRLRKEERKRQWDVELRYHENELRRLNGDLQLFYQRLRLVPMEEQQPDESPLIRNKQLRRLKRLHHYKKLQHGYEDLARRINEELQVLNQEPLMQYDEQRQIFEETWVRFQEDSSRYVHSQLDASYYDESPGTLTTDRFRDLVQASKIVFPTITATEIKDRSKADFMAKTIAFLQTTWFILQCIARAIQHLDLTELELVTLALAVLGGIIAFFWWDKPLGVQVAVPVYLRGVEPVKTLPDEEPGFRETLKRASCEAWGQISSFFLGGAKSFLSDLCNKRKETYYPATFVFRWFIYLPLRQFIYKPIRKLGKSFFDIIQTEVIPNNARHAPTFYAPHFNDQKAIITSLILASVFLPAFAIFFGGLHCIGWDFTYPTFTERTLWRVASLIITGTPVPIFFIYALILYKNWPVFEHLILVFLTVYLVARFFLVVLALVLLRKQPDRAFYAIDWSKFLPHHRWNLNLP